MMRAAGRLMSGSSLAGDPLAWSKRVTQPLVAFDFTSDAAIWDSARVANLAAVPNWTFTRASTGYALDLAGNLVSFASGALRRTDRGVLIEGARTNLLVRSQQMETSWTTVSASVGIDAGVAPDGTMTADKIIPSTSGSGYYVEQAVSLTSGTTYTASVYLKAAGYGTAAQLIGGFGSTWTGAANPIVTVNLLTGTISSSTNVISSSIEALANGWYRVSFTQSAGATAGASIRINPTSSAAGNGTDGILVWGAQLEAAAFASSYIPTTTASVTRAADALTITGVSTATFGAEYTLFADFGAHAVQTSSVPAFSVENGTTNNDCARVGQISAGTNIRAEVRAASAAEAGFTVGILSPAGVGGRGALRVKVNDMNAAGNGTIGTQDTSCAIPTTLTRLVFGYSNQNGLFQEGYIRRAAIWNSAFTNAQLQTQTT